MSELNIHRVTDVKVTRTQRKDYMVMTVVTTSEDYRGIPSVDEQRFFSKNKKMKIKIEKINKVE